MPVGKYLAAYLKTNGLGYTELAKKVEYDTSNLYKLIQGGGNTVSLTSAYRMARNLGVTIEEMIEFKGEN